MFNLDNILIVAREFRKMSTNKSFDMLISQLAPLQNESLNLLRKFKVLILFMDFCDNTQLLTFLTTFLDVSDILKLANLNRQMKHILKHEFIEARILKRKISYYENKKQVIYPIGDVSFFYPKKIEYETKEDNSSSNSSISDLASKPILQTVQKPWKGQKSKKKSSKWQRIDEILERQYSIKSSKDKAYIRMNKEADDEFSRSVERQLWQNSEYKYKSESQIMKMIEKIEPFEPTKEPSKPEIIHSEARQKIQIKPILTNLRQKIESFYFNYK